MSYPTSYRKKVAGIPRGRGFQGGQQWVGPARPPHGPRGPVPAGPWERVPPSRPALPARPSVPRLPWSPSAPPVPRPVPQIVPPRFDPAIPKSVPRFPKVPLRVPLPQPIFLIPMIPDRLPGDFPLQPFAPITPAGWKIQHKYETGPPSQWNGYMRGPRTNTTSANNQCLSGQAIGGAPPGGELYFPVGPDAAPQGNMTVRGDQRFSSFWWQNQSPLGVVTHKHRITYERWPNVAKPNAIVEFPAADPFTWPEAKPWPMVSPWEVPVPHTRPDKGYDLEPVVDPWADPKYDPALMPDPHTLPMPRPGYPQRVPQRLPAPKWQPISPTPSPWPSAPFPNQRPITQPDIIHDGVSVEVTPSKSYKPYHYPRPFARPRQRPSRKESHKKSIATVAAKSWIGKIANAVTEGADFIEAVWHALPAKYRTKPSAWKKKHWSDSDEYWKNRHTWHSVSPYQQLQDIIKHSDKLDMEKLVSNVAKQQLQDYAFGKVSQTLTKNMKPWYDAMGRPVGLQTGPAL